MRRNIALIFASVGSLAVLAACGSGSSNTGTPFDKAAQSRPGVQALVPAPSPTPTPNQTWTINVGKGQINGTDDTFLGGVGVDKGDGDYPNGGMGPANTYFTGPTGDQIPCLYTMASGTGVYHVHAFLGIFYNGSQVALPDGLGIAAPDADMTYHGPGGPIYNFTNYAYDPNDPQKPGCFYEIHTHDASGTIHVESSNPNHVKRTGTIYTLGDLLALWGVSFNISGGQFGPYSGPIQIWWSGAQPLGGPNGSHVTTSNLYQLYTGDINKIPMYSHQVTWILIGTGNPMGSSLPNVAFWSGEEW